MDPATIEATTALVKVLVQARMVTWTLDAFGKPLAAEVVKRLVQRFDERDAAGNGGKVLEKAHALVEPPTDDAPRTPTLEPGLLIEVLDIIPTIDDSDLQDLWARLIAAGIKGSADRSAIVGATQMLRRLTPDDALALALVRDTIKQPRRIEPASGGHALDRALRRLEGLRLVELEPNTIEGDRADAVRRMMAPNRGRLHTSVPRTPFARPRSLTESHWWQLTELGLDFVETVGIAPLASYGALEACLRPLGNEPSDAPASAEEGEP